MGFTEELNLLIKSRYPLIYLESADEEYALRQLREIACGMRLLLCRWSITEGLCREDNHGSYYQTGDPIHMLRTLLELAGSAGFGPGLFVFKDFHRHLGSEVVLRLLKDLILKIKDTPDTIVILAPEYRLPAELEPYAARISGFPDEGEIAAQLMQVIDEAARRDRKIRVVLTPGESTRLIAALKGLTGQQIRNVIFQAIQDDGVLSPGDLSAVEEYKRRVFDRQGFLEFCAAAGRDEIAGFANLKAWLAERAGCFSGDGNGLPPPRGVLLLGVQGCGKSLAVKAVAGELDLPLYQLDLGRVYSKYIGETEQNLHKALEVAERLAPVCLWIDEIEKGFAAAWDGDVDGGVSQRVLGSFLTWMQERKAPCFVAATANDVRRLPPEFLRKGRFDEIFFVDLPDRAQREAVFAIHLRKRGYDPARFDLAALAARAEDYNGAEIEQAVIAALYGATHRKEPLATGHILEKIAATKPLAVLKSEEIAALREWARERTVPA